MDLLNDDLLSLWKTLQQNNVKYIMVGGFASILNGISRVTNDADIFIKDTLENRKALRKSLAELEIGDFESLETTQLIPEFTTIYLNSLMELDIFTNMKYFSQNDFDSCSKEATIADIEGINIPFLHINQLLQEKQANNRPKDQYDIEELNKIISLQNNK